MWSLVVIPPGEYLPLSVVAIVIGRLLLSNFQLVFSPVVVHWNPSCGHRIDVAPRESPRGALSYHARPCIYCTFHTVQRADAAVATTRPRRLAPARAARPTMPAKGGHLPSPIAPINDHVPARGGQGGYPGGALLPTARRQRSPPPSVRPSTVWRVGVAQEGSWRRWRPSAANVPAAPCRTEWRPRVGDGNVAPIRTDRVNICIGATARSCRVWWWRAGTDSPQ